MDNQTDKTVIDKIPYAIDTIFRVDRGRMRNIWYPNKQAEYMTSTRFDQLGLDPDDMGERDPLFGTSATGEGRALPEVLLRRVVDIEHMDVRAIPRARSFSLLWPA